jgi:ketosteroid isomerase-like protein
MARRRIDRRQGTTAPGARRIPDDHPLAAAARRWLRAFQRCVRAVDYAGARPLFANQVYAFGTYASVVRGRTTLARRQWTHIWPSIRGFTFRLAEMRCLGGPAGLCVIVPWDSVGRHPDGATFPRSGRATLFLAPQDGRWVALHSHFSLAPRPARHPAGTPRARGLGERRRERSRRARGLAASRDG